MFHDSFLKFCCKCIYHILVFSFQIARIVGNLIIILRWLSSSFVVATAMPCTKHIISVNSNINDRTHIAQCWTYSKLHNHNTFSISCRSLPRPFHSLTLSSSHKNRMYAFGGWNGMTSLADECGFLVLWIHWFICFFISILLVPM